MLKTIGKKENEILEFKQSLAEKDEAGEAICSIANNKGGTLYFGIKNNGQIVGLQSVTEKSVRELTNYYFDNFEPKIYFSIAIEDIEDLQVIKIDVEKSNQPYHTFKGLPYIRVGSTTRRMSQDEYERKLLFYKSTNRDYSSKTITGTSINDLDPLAIDELKRLLKQSGRYEVDIDKLSSVQLLKDSLLIQDGKLTIAAIVLLGKEDAISRYLPYAEVRYGYKQKEDEIRNQDTVIYKKAYLLYYKAIWDKINARNLTISIPFGMRLIDKKAFDEQTIREAINNAIVHRDYQIAASTIILQYPTKISIKSPGGFPEGVSIANIIHETRPRNKLIADILFKCELVEQFGNGVNLMYKNQLSLGKWPPSYKQSDEKNVILNLDGKIQDLEFAKYVLKVADEKNKDLNDEELIILNMINNNQKVIESYVTDSLLEMGLIEKLGQGKYMLSKQYYSDTNQKWKYTVTKGLSKNTYKELIIQHLVNFGSGRKQDFMKVLKFAVSEKYLEKLLDELKQEKRIYFDGKPRSRTATWKLHEGYTEGTE